MSLFAKKSLPQLLAEGKAQGQGSLQRVLGAWSLVVFGVGIIIGAGIFSVTGMVAANYAGPAITLSFVVAAVACAFAGLCYAEFASMIPIAGSAYTYSYATMGELLAWIIGWDLVLEYAVAAITVAISWSKYFVIFLSDIGYTLPTALTHNCFEGGVLNLPAVIIVVLVSLVLMRGTQESKLFNYFLVAIKLAVLGSFIVLGWQFIQTENFTPYIPENTGEIGVFGWSGVFRGAAVAFFAFLGFDMVSTAAQETRNPQRNMPIGIIGSLFVCTVVYVLFAHVLTGVVSYTEFGGSAGIAPVAIAINHMGTTDANGHFVLAYPWLNKAVMLAILVGYSSVIMLVLMAQSRVFMSMSRDGLLPAIFAKIHPRTKTPVCNNLIFMVLVAIASSIIPADIAGEMISIGTLFAFLLVCAGIIVMRRTQPDAPRGFRVPLVPLIPICGILVCLLLMLFLPADTWIRLVVWMLIGLDVYAAYGSRHSLLAPRESGPRRGMTILRILQMVLAVLCIITAFEYQISVGWQSSKLLFVFSLSFGFIHIVYLLFLLSRMRKQG